MEWETLEHKYTEKTPLGSYKLALPIDRVDLFKNNLSSYAGKGSETGIRQNYLSSKTT